MQSFRKIKNVIWAISSSLIFLNLGSGCGSPLEYVPATPNAQSESRASTGNHNRTSNPIQSPVPDQEEAENNEEEELVAATPEPMPAPTPVTPDPANDPALLAQQGQTFFQQTGCAGGFCHNATPQNDNRLVNKMAEQIRAAMNIRNHNNLRNNNRWPNEVEARQLQEFFKS